MLTIPAGSDNGLETSCLGDRRYVPIYLETPLSQSKEFLPGTEEAPAGFWDSTRQLKRWSTLNLLVAMLNCAVFPCLFTTLGPLFIGKLLEDKRYVALFGICAGAGEIAGSLIAGRIISRLGMKRSALFVTFIGLCAVGMAALAFPLTNGSPIISPNPALFLALGVTLGMGDATNGVILSTLIGRIYREYSQAGFALYSCVFNMGAIGLYIMSSYLFFCVTMGVMVVVVVGTLVAILLLKKREIDVQDPN